MTCRELIEFIIDYLEGEMPAPVRERFQQHLEACPPCKDYLDTYEMTIRLERQAFVDCPETGRAPMPEELVRAILDARQRGEAGGAKDAD